MRRIRLALAAAGALGMLAAGVAPASAATEVNHHGMTVRAAKAARPVRTTNLTYHGGPVETTPSVYISWWGPEWSAGFTTGGYTSAQAQTYTTDFFDNVGGSAWNNIDSQYCQGVAKGTINCGAAGTHITNSAHQLKGAWNDTTAVPSSPTQSNIASAATRLVQHFGYDPNATYFVYTPTGKSMSGFGTQWCAWHSATSSSFGEVAYAYMPYVTDAGASCGANFVNKTNSSYGNGYFDGFSVVGGHEFAEAQTDPHTFSGGYAWEDSSGSENGDKCAWSAASGNITLGSHSYAVQPIWSNASSACAMSG